MTPNAAHIAQRLNKHKRSGAGWIACCPAHEDRTPSLSINDGDKGPVFHCHAGCTQESVLTAIEALGVTIRKVNGNGMNGHTNDLPLLTVDALAAAKGIDQSTIIENHVDNSERGLSFDYLRKDLTTAGTKYRKYLSGGADRGFSWSQGSKPCLYGLWRLDKDYANDGRVILCEGETDALTLWQHGFTAVGLPGASMWKDEWASDIPEGAKVYVILEPDQGGRTVEAAIEKSALRSRAYFIRMPEAAKDPNAMHLGSAAFVEDFEKLIATAEPVVTPKPPSIVLRHISDVIAEKREASWLIHKTLELGVMAVIAGTRGTFKSFVAVHWSMLAAIEGNPIIMLSAEGAGMDRRVSAWLKSYAPLVDPRSLPVLVLEKAVNLNSAEVLTDLQIAIEASGYAPKVILVDTFSKYSPGIDENDNGEVAAFIQTLSAALRERYGCTVILVAHAGHGDAKRPRGASTLMANPDAEYIVDRPDPKGMIISVSRDRFKDSPSMPSLNYKAELVDLGRLDSYGDPVTSLVMRQTDEVAPMRKPTGKAQRQLLGELERLITSGEDKLGVWSIQTLREISRGLGAHRNSARDASLGLIQMQFLTPTIGGYRLSDSSIKVKTE